MHRRPLARLLALALPCFSAPVMITGGLLPAGALLAGCSEEGEPEAEPGSVREALFSFNAALKNQNEEEARRWVIDEPNAQRAFEIMYLVSVVQQDFIARVTEKWGKDSLAIFQEAPGAKLDEIVPYAPREVLEKVIVNEVGEIAIATFEDGNRMRFERTDGRWRLNTIGSDRPEDLAQAIPSFKLMEAVALGIQKALEQIDEPDITADYFDLLLGRQIEASVRDFEVSMQKLYEDAQKRAEEEARNTVGPQAGPQAPAAPGVPPGHDEHDGHDHGGGR